MKVIVTYLALAVLTTSCVQHRQLINFRQDEEGSLDGYSRTIELPALTVQPNDILYITVNSLNDAASLPFNLVQAQQQGGQGGGGVGAMQDNQLLLRGYNVDSTGHIDFPNIGRIEVGGLPLEGVREVIIERLLPFLPNPAVNVKFLNFRYSIIGDVNAPGTYTSISQRISLLEAIATAGDLTPYANRNRVVVIREKNGVRTATELDLQAPEFFASPYYYMQQNDVVYIEPNQAKVATVDDPLSRFIGYGSAFLSIVSITLALVLRN